MNKLLIFTAMVALVSSPAAADLFEWHTHWKPTTWRMSGGPPHCVTKPNDCKSLGYEYWFSTRAGQNGICTTGTHVVCVPASQPWEHGKWVGKTPVCPNSNPCAPNEVWIAKSKAGGDANAKGICNGGHQFFCAKLKGNE